MATYLLCFAPILLYLISWAFGNLMRSIGIVLGWNPKIAFWVSAIAYPLILIAIYLDALLVYRFDGNGSIVAIIYILLLFGILSPLINFLVRWAYPDFFVKSNNDLKYKSKTNIYQVESKKAAPYTGLARSRIFLSYRRSDSADITGRIYDRLIVRFGKNNIFKDVDSIPLGLDFKAYIDKKVGECDVLLAVIGDRWLDVSDSSGNARLKDPADSVRIEIEAALNRDIAVIPLLVRGMEMPHEERLPSSLRKLVNRNGIPIRSDPDFHRDMDRLISALEKYIQ